MARKDVEPQPGHYVTIELLGKHECRQGVLTGFDKDGHPLVQGESGKYTGEGVIQVVPDKYIYDPKEKLFINNVRVNIGSELDPIKLARGVKLIEELLAQHLQDKNSEYPDLEENERKAKAKLKRELRRELRKGNLSLAHIFTVFVDMVDEANHDHSRAVFNDD